MYFCDAVKLEFRRYHETLTNSFAVLHRTVTNLMITILLSTLEVYKYLNE